LPPHDRSSSSVTEAVPAAEGRFVDLQGTELSAPERPWMQRAELSAPGRRGYVLRRLLALSDVLALIAAYPTMVGLRELFFERLPTIPIDLTLFAALLPLWVALGTVLKLYHVGDRGLDYSVADEIGPVFLVATVWNWVLLLTSAALEPGPVLEVLPSILLWASAVVLVPLFRVLTIWFARRASWYRQRVLVIGSPADARRIIRRIDRHPEYGLDVVAVATPDGSDGSFRAAIDSEDTAPPDDLIASTGNGHARGGEVDALGLVRLAEQADVSRVVVASAPAGLSERSELIRDMIDAGAQVDLISGEPDLCSSSAAALHYVEGLPVLTVPSVQVPRTWKAVKRSVDLGIASLAVLVLAPALAACAIAIKLSSPGPVLFRQRRIGRQGESFELLKFRTMVAEAEELKGDVSLLNMHAPGEQRASMFKIRKDPRITRVGSFLRRWSLDELPQLWNVIKGEMSLVGPRPLIAEEAALAKGRYGVRLEMRPGITGPWQTMGRSDIGFEDMVKLDYTYVMNWTLAEDFKLMIRTAEAIARGGGAY
jgi:exopolysaccharide biosynthesis polyprenyl glycosylphosphotransferase